MKVTAEYFCIRGLNIARYMEKLSTLNIIITMPKGVVWAAPPLVVLLKIR